ncbi:hypothetical protein B566_EDAN014158 [Ephemera danica]|nr:hypothetical protein B566_EDAN014158 [Ephemera danica]
MAGIHILSVSTDSLLKYAPAKLIRKPKATTAKKSRRDPLYRDIQTGDEVLDILLPPREFNGENPLDYYIQKVSRAPATERDIEKLREDLDRKMFEQGVRLSGPCVMRRELYAQVLDELIRMETIACAETGVLLAAWRDHCARNLAAYESLYVSRLTNENEKFLGIAQRKLELRELLAQLAAQQSELELRVTRAEARLAHACKARDERATIESKSQQQQVESLNETTTEGLVQLKARLKKMKSGM